MRSTAACGRRTISPPAADRMAGSSSAVPRFAATPAAYCSHAVYLFSMRKRGKIAAWWSAGDEAMERRGSLCLRYVSYRNERGGRKRGLRHR